ncbi:PucR family transcriptional regulator [Nocardia sp. NPDC001965]
MSLDTTLQDLADRLHKPLVVLDIDRRVMAVSVHETDLDRMRLSLLFAGRALALTDEMTKRYRLSSATGPVYVPGHNDEVARIVVPLRSRKRLFGYLYGWVDTPGSAGISDEEQREFIDAAPELGRQLALRLAELQHGMEHSRHLLTGLLGDSDADRSRCAFRLLDEGRIDHGEQYSVLVYRTPDTQSVSETGMAVEATLDFVTRSTTVKIVGAVVGSEGILVFPRRVDPDRLSAIMARSGLEPVRAGIGSTVDSLDRAVVSYRRARLAWQATRADPARYGRIAYWDGLGADRLLLRLPLDELTVDDLPAGVGRLLAAPAAAESADTLESYLAAGGDVQETARRLGIHRSTLYSRLHRIREVTDCDITDGVVRSDLHTGLRVARLAGLLPAASSSEST